MEDNEIRQEKDDVNERLANILETSVERVNSMDTTNMSDPRADRLRESIRNVLRDHVPPSGPDVEWLTKLKEQAFGEIQLGSRDVPGSSTWQQMKPSPKSPEQSPPLATWHRDKGYTGSEGSLETDRPSLEPFNEEYMEDTREDMRRLATENERIREYQVLMKDPAFREAQAWAQARPKFEKPLLGWWEGAQAQGNDINMEINRGSIREPGTFDKWKFEGLQEKYKKDREAFRSALMEKPGTSSWVRWEMWNEAEFKQWRKQWHEAHVPSMRFSRFNKRY